MFKRVVGGSISYDKTEETFQQNRRFCRDKRGRERRYSDSSIYDEGRANGVSDGGQF